MSGPVLQELRPARRTDLLVGPPVLRGPVELHLVKDPVGGGRYELRAKEWFVLCRLDGRRTLREVGEEYARRFGSRLGDAHWEHLLRLLYGRGLMADGPRPDPRPVAGPAGTTGPEVRRRSTVLSGSTRLVADAPALLDRLHARTAFARTRWFGTLLLALSGALTVLLAARTGELLRDLGRLSEQPVLLLAVGTVLWTSLALHELAHGVVGRAYGGRVTEIGLRWRLPVTYLYCRVEDVPFFARRRHQVATAAAGAVANLAFLLPCYPVWLVLPDGSARHGLGGLLLLGAAMGLANLVPLPPLDGYKLLGYALGVSRLAEGSRRFLRLAAVGAAGRGEGIAAYGTRARLVYGGYGLLAGLLLGGPAAGAVAGASTLLAHRYGGGAALVPPLLVAAALLLWAAGLTARRRRDRRAAARSVSLRQN
ncbi:peptidase M50 [Kitasatospora sp. NPDC059571]|uniref:peptidase M50 n=1 Tax=Kitasatospora sp. NPDC059571 TaxID=3346871 RepID=UPI0036A076E9